MGWSDAIEESLPAPRDDEPADLRRDIADELGDHLACAMDRERRRSDDDDAAKATVLSKFGSPQAVARRLWWEAMKEKVMTQRLTLAAAGVAMLACLGVALLAWMTLERTQEVNLAIIAKLEALAAPQPVAAPQSLEWTEVRFRLVEGNEKGAPAEGFRVELTGQPINDTPMILEETAGSDGLVKFGPIRPGQYGYTVYSPWNQHTSGQLVALPGAKAEETMKQVRHLGPPRVAFLGPKAEETILCPASPTPEGTVKFDLKWPEEVREALKEHHEVEANDLWAECRFKWHPQTISLGDDNWERKAVSGIVVIIRPDGSLLPDRLKFTVRRHGQGMAGTAGPMPAGAGAGMGLGAARPPGITIETVTPIDLNELDVRKELTWREGEYVLYSVGLLLHSADPENSEQFTLERFHEVYNRGGDDWTFQLKPNQKNDWTIEVPMKYLNSQQTGPGGGGLPGSGSFRNSVDGDKIQVWNRSLPSTSKSRQASAAVGRELPGTASACRTLPSGTSGWGSLPTTLWRGFPI